MGWYLFRDNRGVSSSLLKGVGSAGIALTTISCASPPKIPLRDQSDSHETFPKFVLLPQNGNASSLRKPQDTFLTKQSDFEWHIIQTNTALIMQRKFFEVWLNLSIVFSLEMHEGIIILLKDTPLCFSEKLRVNCILVVIIYYFAAMTNNILIKLSEVIQKNDSGKFLTKFVP